MKTRFLVLGFLVMVLILLVNVAIVYAPPPIPRAPSAPRVSEESEVAIPDDPVIREFSASPTNVVQGGQVTFSWRVEPTRGSPITGVRITVGAIELCRLTSARGEQRVTLPPSLEPRPSWAFVLTATNEIGRSSSRTLNLSVVADAPVIREVSVTPSNIFRGDQITFRWRVEPLGTSPINRIRITRGTTEIYSSTASSGEHIYTFNLSPTGEREELVLTATNQAGRSTRRSLYLGVAYPNQFSLFLSTEPSEIIPGSPYTLIFRITNDSDVRLSGIDIQINWSGGGTGISEGEFRPLELRGQTINPGSNTYRFAHTIPRGTTRLERFNFWVGRTGRITILQGEANVEVTRTINVYRVRRTTW